MVEDLEVTEVGAGDTLVAFLHGVLDRGRSFQQVAELLDGECRSIRYDRRGYGEPVDDPPGVLGHAEDLLAILDGRPAVVVGHSFGGVTALAAAVAAPEVVQAVVLYETAIAWAPGWDDTAMRGVFASDDPAETGLRMLFPRLDAMPPGEQAIRRARARAFIAEERSVRLAEPPFDLRDVKVPVRYGRGATAWMMPAVVEHLAREVPDVEVVELPGVDHHAHRTAPAAFAELVRRALSS